MLDDVFKHGHYNHRIIHFGVVSLSPFELHSKYYQPHLHLMLKMQSVKCAEGIEIRMQSNLPHHIHTTSICGLACIVIGSPSHWPPHNWDTFEK